MTTVIFLPAFAPGIVSPRLMCNGHYQSALILTRAAIGASVGVRGARGFHNKLCLDGHRLWWIHPLHQA